MSMANLGAYKGAGSDGLKKIPVFESWLGQPCTRFLDFMPYGSSWSNTVGGVPWICGSWGADPQHRPLTLSVPMLPNDSVSTLAQGAAGAFDANFTKIATTLNNSGFGSSILRIGWEFNGGWYPWAAAKDKASWVTFFRRIVMAMRGVSGTHFTIDWCPVLGWQQLATDQVYPGDDVVDVIGSDVYNQWWNVADQDPAHRWATLRDQNYGLAWQKKFAASHGKKISFPEWGTGTRPDGHGGGDDPLFINNMAAWMQAAGDTLLYHNYWDYPASDFNALLSDGHQPLAGAAFRGVWGPTPIPVPPPTPPAPDPHQAILDASAALSVTQSTMTQATTALRVASVNNDTAMANLMAAIANAP